MQRTASNLLRASLLCLLFFLPMSLANAQSLDALAAKGAAIANVDSVVAAARKANPDPDFRRGFDIATAIFGDPALGSQGHTATGPGSTQIRNALNAAGQRGFDASVKLNLGRNYQASASAPARSPFLVPLQASAPDHRRIAGKRVPDVVGLLPVEAQSALYKLGFKTKWTFEAKPDPSTPYGHVRATVPPAGTLVTGNAPQVEILIPGVASLVGIGALSVSDLERRDGFDLDEGHYQEIYQGADIVVRKRDQQKHVESDGHTWYDGGGIYVEPSDGAVFSVIQDVRDQDDSQLGSLPYSTTSARERLRKGPLAAS